MCMRRMRTPGSAEGGSSIFYLFGPPPQKIEKSSILCTGAETGHVLNEDGERFFCTVDSMRRHK